MRERLEETNRQYRDDIVQRDEIENRLKEARRSERLNKNGRSLLLIGILGIMEGSMLTVTVMEAKDLKAMDYGGTSDPYAILKLSQQQVETSYIKNTLNPVWDETYTFDVQAREEILRVVVMDRDAVGTDDFEGKCNIPLRDLRD